MIRVAGLSSSPEAETSPAVRASDIFFDAFDVISVFFLLNTRVSGSPSYSPKRTAAIASS